MRNPFISTLTTKLAARLHSLRSAVLEQVWPSKSPVPDPVQTWEEGREESLAFHRQKEKQQNEESRLPQGEKVHFPCIWLAEVYLSSHIPALIRGLEALGWTPDWDLGTDHELTTWIQSIRRSGRGAGRHGSPFVLSTRWPKRAGYEFSAELPDDVHSVRLEIFQPSPTYVVVVGIFDLEESLGDRVCAKLSADYEIEVESVGTGWTYTAPSEKRGIEVDKLRGRVLEQCSFFMAKHLPGFFATRGNCEHLPSADLVLLQNTPLDSDERPRKSFLDSLGLDSPFLDYLAIDSPGLLLRLTPEARPSERGLTLAAASSELLPGDELEGYGGRTPAGFANRLDGISEFLGLWALIILISDLDEEIAEDRDALAAAINADDSGSTVEIQELQQSVAALASDFLFTLNEWQSGSGLRYLSEDAAAFKSRESLGLKGHTIDLAEQIKEDAARIISLIAILRDTLQAQCNLIAARANERASRRNQAIQVVNVLLTAVNVVIAAVAVAIAIFALTKRS